ncbi:peptidoglycan DD-metalloendopeptidase family protein [Heliobacterium undosum]|uniref:Peptidoglycan DD-metalloendopeptidase family protein n=1 Tax=Heliomicrobium undosum TaxID=121734 RepID=A0A845KZ23_9FIRM|nr:M23 family metallopeptidase [Heliomicrobium undosum]MZP28346.1 peptidoglycan DD-metalloendopeptidase family protein [Heliomicrobium undosum]
MLTIMKNLSRTRKARQLKVVFPNTGGDRCNKATSSGNKRGYVQTSKINVPWFTYQYSKPITTGSRTNDFGSHAGIDIGVSSGASVYAITSGSAKYRTAYEVIGTTRYAVSYGNFVELTFGSNKAIYAHLSSFAPYTAPSYPNTSPPRGASTNTLYIEHGTITVSSGTRLGATGNSGNSSGPHLHFEIKEGTTSVDPYKYVLFPKMPW